MCEVEIYVFFCSKVVDYLVMLVANLPFLGVLLLTHQKASGNLCEPNEYSSLFSNYLKLVGNAANFDTWVARCEGN